MNKKKKKIVIRKGDGSALTVMGGQNDNILPDGALRAPGLEYAFPNEVIIDHINELVAMPFDYVAATKAGYPRRNHIEHKIFGRPYCVIMTPGQERHKDLTWLYDDRADEILPGGMNPAIINYSIVIAPHFVQHIENLRLHDIERIFLAGWFYNNYVGESAIAYAMQGFEVYVVRNVTRSIPKKVQGFDPRMNEKLDAYGVEIISMDEIEG